MANFLLFSVFCCFAVSAFGDALSNDLLPGLTMCGRNFVDSIYRGELTTISEFPWIALLEYEQPNGKGFECGGALINNRYILTAAHCIKAIPKTMKLISVRLGEHNLNTETDCESEFSGYEYCSDPPLNIGIEEQIVHEQYNSSDMNRLHDIALLRLNEEVNFSEFVGPICLPTTTALGSKIYDNAHVTVAGWGKTGNNPQTSVKLKWEVTVMPQRDCASAYNQVKLNLTDSQMCSGSLTRKQSCSGDSGGPLMDISRTDHEENWFVVGIPSFGPSTCGNERWPQVYTKVANYLPWIVKNVRA